MLHEAAVVLWAVALGDMGPVAPIDRARATDERTTWSEHHVVVASSSESFVVLVTVPLAVVRDFTSISGARQTR